MTRFVTEINGAEVGLPAGLALLDRSSPFVSTDYYRYQLRMARNDPPASADGWISYDTHHLHGWKTLPTIRRLWLALRRDDIPDDIMSAEEIDRWAEARAIESDVAWYRERRAPIRPPKSMGDDELYRAMDTLTREASERAAAAAEGDLGRAWDPLVNGRRLSTMMPEELDHLFVAIDWHRAGRPSIGGNGG